MNTLQERLGVYVCVCETALPQRRVVSSINTQSCLLQGGSSNQKKSIYHPPSATEKRNIVQELQSSKNTKTKKKKRIAPKTVRSPGAFCRQRQPTVHGRDRESPSKDNEDEHRPEHGPCDRSEQEGLAVRGEVQDKQESGSRLRFPPWLPLPIYRINCPL